MFVSAVGAKEALVRLASPAEVEQVAAAQVVGVSTLPKQFDPLRAPDDLLAVREAFIRGDPLYVRMTDNIFAPVGHMSSLNIDCAVDARVCYDLDIDFIATTERMRGKVGGYL
jgi:hypothetical protein